MSGTDSTVTCPSSHDHRRRNTTGPLRNPLAIRRWRDGRAKELVGDRDPRAHEFSLQLRAFDASRGGSSLGIAVLLALCGALLQKSVKGGLVVAGGLNLGGSIDPVYNAVSVAELAVEKGSTILLIPVSARKQLAELSDEMAIKITVQYFTDSRDALLKAIGD